VSATSSSTAISAKHDTIDEMGEGVLASAPERFVLIGISMGGYVARTMARRLQIVYRRSS
jgi:thioesterase domain-containing protein